MRWGSFEADLVLDWAYSSVEKEGALLDLSLLTDQVLHLLSQEVVLVDVHVLEFSEITFNIIYVFDDFLECVIINFDCLMLKRGELRP